MKEKRRRIRSTHSALEEQFFRIPFPHLTFVCIYSDCTERAVHLLVVFFLRVNQHHYEYIKHLALNITNLYFAVSAAHRQFNLGGQKQTKTNVIGVCLCSSGFVCYKEHFAKKMRCFCFALILCSNCRKRKRSMSTRFSFDYAQTHTNIHTYLYILFFFQKIYWS